jgi:hypothetical protein
VKQGSFFTKHICKLFTNEKASLDTVLVVQIVKTPGAKLKAPVHSYFSLKAVEGREREGVILWE